MPAVHSYDYAVLRVVPHVEREEFINAGVLLFCRTLRFLGCRTQLNRQRLAVLAPDCDPVMVESQLELIESLVTGGPSTDPIGLLPQADRFHWLTSPRSTVIQVSPVHCGLCQDPQASLDHLFEQMVL